MAFYGCAISSLDDEDDVFAIIDKKFDNIKKTCVKGQWSYDDLLHMV